MASRCSRTCERGHAEGPVQTWAECSRTFASFRTFWRRPVRLAGIAWKNYPKRDISDNSVKSIAYAIQWHAQSLSSKPHLCRTASSLDVQRSRLPTARLAPLSRRCGRHATQPALEPVLVFPRLFRFRQCRPRRPAPSRLLEPTPCDAGLGRPVPLPSPETAPGSTMWTRYDLQATTQRGRWPGRSESTSTPGARRVMRKRFRQGLRRGRVRLPMLHRAVVLGLSGGEQSSTRRIPCAIARRACRARASQLASVTR